MSEVSEVSEVPEISEASTPRTSSTKSTKSSIRGYKLSVTEKVQIKKAYDALDAKKMWKLSSGRFFEEVMKEFALKLNYEQ